MWVYHYQLVRGLNDLSSDRRSRTMSDGGLVDTCHSIHIQVSIMFHMIYALGFLNQSMERSARSHWKRTKVMSFKFQPIQKWCISQASMTRSSPRQTKRMTCLQAEIKCTRPFSPTCASAQHWATISPSTALRIYT